MTKNSLTEPFFNQEAEMSALGSCMLEHSKVAALRAMGVSGTSFYLPSHQKIWAAIVDSGTSDSVPVSAALVASGELESVGGREYLVQLMEFVPSPSNAEHYGRIVLDLARRRGIRLAAQNALKAVSNGMADEDLAQAVRSLNVAITPAEGSPFVPLSMDDVMLLPAKEWLIKGFLGKGDLMMIYGKANRGKSFVALDLCACLAKGSIAFAKNFYIDEPYTSVYCSGEKKGGLPERIKALRANWELTDEEIARITLFNEVPQLFLDTLPTAADVFIASLKPLYPFGFDALIIDTKSRATIGAEENSPSDQGKEIAAAKRIQDAFGCAVIVLHHPARHSTTPRGATAWDGACDELFEVTEEEGQKILRCEKMGDARMPAAIGFDLSPMPGTDSLAVFWKGSIALSPRTIGEEALAILKHQPLKAFTSAEVQDLCTLDATKSALTTALNRLAKAADSGVSMLDASLSGSSRGGRPQNRYMYEPVNAQEPEEDPYE